MKFLTMNRTFILLLGSLVFMMGCSSSHADRSMDELGKGMIGAIQRDDADAFLGYFMQEDDFDYFFSNFEKAPDIPEEEAKKEFMADQKRFSESIVSNFHFFRTTLDHEGVDWNDVHVTQYATDSVRMKDGLEECRLNVLFSSAGNTYGWDFGRCINLDGKWICLTIGYPPEKI